MAIQELAIRGGIFGPDGQNYGLLFGVKDERTHLTGLAIGQKPQRQNNFASLKLLKELET